METQNEDVVYKNPGFVINLHVKAVIVIKIFKECLFELLRNIHHKLTNLWVISIILCTFS